MNAEAGIKISRIQATIVIAPSGDIDFREMTKIKKIICEDLLRDQPRFVLCLKKVEFVNYLAIGVLVAVLKTVRNCNGDLKLAEMSAPVRQIFSFVGMDELFEIYSTIEEAIEAFDEEWVGQVETCQ
jgi:anti-sigma B factor antagonist